MNELKRELMKVAGDLSASEVRVKEAVMRRTQKKKRKFVPALAVGVMALFMLAFFNPFSPEQTAANLTYEEYAYYLQVEMDMWGDGINEEAKKNAFEKMLVRIGRTEYGKSLGLTVTEADVAEWRETNKEMLQSPEYKKMIQKMLNEANISESVYQEKIEPKQTVANLMGKQLVQQLQEKYALLNNGIATLMVDEYAMDYMEQHYSEEIQAFRTQYEIKPRHALSTTVMGIVGLVEGNMFYLIQDATFPDVTGMGREEIIATYFKDEKGAWYPNVDNLHVRVGDIVTVQSNTWQSEGTHRVGMNYGGAEIIQRADEPTAKIQLTGADATQFTEQIQAFKWENSYVSMGRLPDYIVTVEGVTYSMWIKINKSGLEIVRHEPNAYVSLTKSKAAPLFELLQ